MLVCDPIIGCPSVLMTVYVISGVKSTGPGVDTFEERMEKYLSGELEDPPGEHTHSVPRVFMYGCTRTASW